MYESLNQQPAIEWEDLPADLRERLLAEADKVDELHRTGQLGPGESPDDVRAWLAKYLNG